VRGIIVSALVSCHGASGSVCTITLGLTTTKAPKGGSKTKKTEKRKTIVGTKTVTLAVGDSETVHVKLNGVGQRLLKDRRKLSVKFKATANGANGTMVGVSSQRIRFKAPSKKTKR